MTTDAERVAKEAARVAEASQKQEAETAAKRKWKVIGISVRNEDKAVTLEASPFQGPHAGAADPANERRDVFVKQDVIVYIGDIAHVDGEEVTFRRPE